MGRTRLATAVAVLVLLGSIWSAALAGAGDNSADGPPPVGESQLAQALAAANARTERLKDERASAEASAERKDSRTRYAGQAPGDALALDRAKAQPVLADPKPIVAGRVLDYLDDYSARVDTGSGATGTVVDSSVPLRTRDAAGARRATDLSLVEAPGGFEPRAAIAPLEIGASASDGVRMPERGFGLIPAVRAGLPAGQIVGGAAFWPNAFEDADYAVRPTVTGFETFEIVRSAAAPEDYSYRLDLPSGATARAALGGSVEITKDGRDLAAILPPSATAADGWPVKVTQTLTGDVLTIHVAHQDADVAYPITVDPAVVDAYTWASDSYVASWSFNAPGKFAPWQGCGWMGCGLYLRDLNADYFTDGEYGWYRYGVPGNQSEAQITSFSSTGQLDGMGANPGMCFVWGIAMVGYWSAGPTIDCSGPGGKSSSLGPTGSGIAAYWEVVAQGSGPRTAWSAALNSAQVGVTDGTPPAASSFLPVGWTDDPAASVGATIRDNGLGVSSATLKATSFSGWTGGTTVSGTGCVRIWCNGSLAVSGTVANLPEGNNEVEVVAKDPANNASDASSTTAIKSSVKVDTSEPSIGFSGTLWQAANQTITAGSYTVTVSATDGSTSSRAAERSGVRTIQIALDGAQVESTYQECATSCPLSDSWTYSPAGQPAGVHTLEAVATDQVGHQSVASFDFAVGPCCLKPAVTWTSSGAPTSVADTLYQDVNGDAAADQVDRTSNGTLFVALSTTTGFAPAMSWGSLASNQSRYAGDVDGDHRSDVIGVTNGGAVGVSRANELSFDSQQTWANLPTKTKPFFADADSDGRYDLIVQNTQTGSVQVALSTGSAFGPFVTWGSAPVSNDVRFADVNRDGTADLITRNTSTGVVQVGPSSGSAFATPATWGSLPAADDLYAGDINQDLAADLVGRNRTTGNLDVALSTSTAFGSVQAGGNWPLVNTMQLADVTADAERDVVGRNATLGQTSVAVMNTSLPVGARLLAPPLDPTVPYDSEGTAGGSVEMSPVPDDPAVATSARATIRYQLGFEDERLVTRRGISDTGPIYTALKQAGVTVIRFKAYWGELQTPGGSSRIDSSHLKTAVAEAGAAGFTVQLAITGRVGQDDCSPDEDTGHFDGDPTTVNLTLGCHNIDTQPAAHCDDLPAPKVCGTGVNPDPDSFRTFVQQVVSYFSSPSRAQPVLRYSIWNEPNNARFLRGGTLVQIAQRYRQLYQQGYLGVHDGAGTGGADCGCHPRIFFGEFSELDRGSTKKGRATPLDFMRNVLDPLAGDTDGLVTSGVAYHPYQHYTKPGDGHDYGRDVGIGRLRDIVAAVKDRYNDPRIGSSHRRIRTARGYIPNLFLTEFGYLNRRTSRTAATDEGDTPYWHSEHERATWLPIALSIANAPRNRVRELVLYHATEVRPDEAPANPNYDPQDPADFPYQDHWDSGMIGKDGAVTGDREYGAGPAGQPVIGPGYPREAFCAVWKWMKQNNRNSASDASPCSAL